MRARVVPAVFGSILALAVLASGIALAPPTASEIIPAAQQAMKPRRIILLIGDGMGLSQLAAASIIEHGPEGGFAIESAKHIGLIRTHAADRLVTDSGASATAYATGFKTTYYGVAMEPGGVRLRTLMEAAQDKGLATGVMTTTFLFDATPAAFTAHAEKRSEFTTLFEQMLHGRTDVLLGGDANVFAAAEKGDNAHAIAIRDLVRNQPESERLRILTDPDALADDSVRAHAGRIVGFFPRRDPDVIDANGEDVFGPPLADMLDFTLNRIGEHPAGFLIMAECEETDAAGHANDTERMVRGVKELDAALVRALAFARDHPDTLVLVTADHDTGDAKIINDRARRFQPVIEWTTKDHSAEWIPIYAFGRGAEQFTGIMDNTELGRRLGALLDLPDFPRRIVPVSAGGE